MLLLLALCATWTVCSAVIDGYWTGTLTTRVAFSARHGRVCLAPLVPPVEQSYTLLIRNNRFERTYRRLTAPATLDAERVTVTRPDAVQTGTVLQHDEQTGLARIQLDGDDRQGCILFRVSANRTLTEYVSFAAMRNGTAARCDALAQLESVAVTDVTCEVMAGNSYSARPADIDSVVEVAQLQPDCLVSEWSTGNDCSVSCGGGTSMRTRTILDPNGVPEKCPELEEEDPIKCNAAPCSTNCDYTPWSDWSSCDATCGDGEQYRTRAPTGFSIGNPNCLFSFGENPLPPTHEVRACQPSLPACVVNQDCAVSLWSEWSDCSLPCKQSITDVSPTRTRTRLVTQQPLGNGTPCPLLLETNACNEFECKPNCASCPTTLIPGEATWCRCCANANLCPSSSFDLNGCIASNFCNDLCLEGKRCDGIVIGDAPPIELDCVVSAWSDFGVCEGGSCDATGAITLNGARTANRRVTRAPSGSKTCPPLSKTESCEPACASQVAPGTDPCRAGEWSAWSARCKCGGKRSRTRTVAPIDPEASCPTREETDCDSETCSADCVYSQWSDWSVCSQSCSSGAQFRTREAVSPARNGGLPCSTELSVLRDTRTCNTFSCGQDCNVAQAQAVSDCSTPCGQGVQDFERFIIAAPWGENALDCPSDLTSQRPCFLRPCRAGECGLGTWSGWSECSAPCSGGTTTRTRTVPALCGTDRFDASESEPCNTFACPMVLNSFSDVGMKGNGGVLDSAALDTLAASINVDRERLAVAPADQRPPNAAQYDNVLRVFDADGDPAQRHVDRLVGNVQRGDTPFTSAVQLVASTYNVVVVRTNAPTPEPTRAPTPLATTALDGTTEANGGDTITTTEPLDAASSTDTTADDPMLATSDTPDALPIWVPIVIVFGIILLIVAVLAIVASVLSAKKGRQEAERRGVIGTVTSTEQLGGTSLGGMGQDDSSSEPDEGSEVREFRRQQQRRRRTLKSSSSRREDATEQKNSDNTTTTTKNNDNNSESASGAAAAAIDSGANTDTTKHSDHNSNSDASSGGDSSDSQGSYYSYSYSYDGSD